VKQKQGLSGGRGEDKGFVGFSGQDARRKEEGKKKRGGLELNQPSLWGGFGRRRLHNKRKKRKESGGGGTETHDSVFGMRWGTKKKGDSHLRRGKLGKNIASDSAFYEMVREKKKGGEAEKEVREDRVLDLDMLKKWRTNKAIGQTTKKIQGPVRRTKGKKIKTEGKKNGVVL